MGYAISDFIEAIAKKLVTMYPDRKVYDDKIGSGGYNNCFYVSVVSSNQTMLLDGRCERAYLFDILYFAANDSKESFFDWVDRMYPEFIRLRVGRSLHLTKDLEIKMVDRVGHCSFSVIFRLKPYGRRNRFTKLTWKGSIKKNG